MTRLLYGDPSVAAQELERAERHERKLIDGTGCHNCTHGERAWGQYACMINRQHPECVRWHYRERSEL